MYDDNGNYIGPALEETGEKTQKKRKKKEVVDPFEAVQEPDHQTLSPFFTTNKVTKYAVQTFGEKEVDDPRARWKGREEETPINPKLNPNMPKDTAIIGACDYGNDVKREKVLGSVRPLAPVAREAMQREKEKKKKLRDAKGKTNRFNAREKRKRDMGMSNGEKNFVEEEKRILRQQFCAQSSLAV
eukprot:TRINITY_DN67044_c4_g3_i2.p2 TRINITY_DN67044_c4_g3~~TRINITY_DN67044_c4_g3_i2.p2  ORF type:complete len:186 (-),score=36.93 TRINITY_DN67044_c4_g3_i2:1346-1903(-)